MDNYEKIEQLLLTKDYEQLNETERHFILNILTEIEYRKMRNNMTILKDFLDREVQLQHPLESVEGSIMDSFDKHHQLKQDRLGNSIWIKRSVPLWSFAATIALLIIINGWLIQWKPEAKMHYLTKSDTLYLEKHIMDTIFVEKKILKSGHQTKLKTNNQDYPTEITTSPSPNKTVASAGITIPNAETLRNTKINLGGTSMSEDAAKEKLTVEIL